MRLCCKTYFCIVFENQSNNTYYLPTRKKRTSERGKTMLKTPPDSGKHTSQLGKKQPTILENYPLRSGKTRLRIRKKSPPNLEK